MGKTYVSIDSRDRDYASFPEPGEYRITIPKTLHHVTSARIMSAEIPTSFHVFSAARANTSMVVALNGNARTVTVPDGNYGATAMAAALRVALDAAFPTVAFTVVISATTMLASISTSSPGNTIAVDTTATSADSFQQSQWGLAWYLGFERGTVASATGILVAPRVVCLNPELYILLDIQELSRVHESGIYGGGGSMGPTFAKIPLNAMSQEIAFFDKQITSNALDPPLARLDALRIRFRFHDGTAVNFQGVDHSFTLEFESSQERSTW